MLLNEHITNADCTTICTVMHKYILLNAAAHKFRAICSKLAAYPQNNILGS
jgi:hypothetical protein